MCFLSDKASVFILKRLIVLILVLVPSQLNAKSPPPPLFFAITEKPTSPNISNPFLPVEEDIVLDAGQCKPPAFAEFEELADPVDDDSDILESIMLRNYHFPHSEGHLDSETLSVNNPPSAREFKKAKRKMKMMFPVLSLAALNNYIFAGTPIDASGTSYSQFYDSLLVLGGSNHLADGMAELLNESGLDIVNARSASLIIMLVPAESRAIYNDLTLNAKKLTFEEALNHDAFKSASNQVNHIVTELALPYIKDNINTKKYPGLEKMLAGAMSAVAMAAPPVLFQIIWGLSHGGDIKLGKMAVDSGVGFMYSTAVTTFKGVNQQAAHVYLDAAKGAPWCDPEERDCTPVDDDGVLSELMAGAICYIGAELVDLVTGMIPAPVPLKAASPALINTGKKILNNGLKLAPPIMKQTSGHLRKVTAYAGSDALNKKMKKELAHHTDESEFFASLLTFMSNIGVSYVSSQFEDGKPYKTGFGMRSVNAINAMGIILTTKAMYFTGLNHAFGLSEPLHEQRDYYTRTRAGTALLFPNLQDEQHDYTPERVQIVHPIRPNIPRWSQQRRELARKSKTDAGTQLLYPELHGVRLQGYNHHN